MKNIIASLLILASIGIFFGLIKPAYGNVLSLQSQIKTYDDALSQGNILQAKISADKQQLASFSQSDVDRLNKLIPDTIDNVKLIIDIKNIALQSGMLLKSINVSDTKDAVDQSGNPTSNNPFGIQSVDLSFVVTSSYPNFVLFLQRLEQSLRLVDVRSVSFTPTDTSNVYDFSVTLRTYWLK